MKRNLILILVLFFIGGGIFLLEKPVLRQGDTTQQKIIFDTPALNLELQDSEGNNYFLGDFVGKPLVLNAWASWCPFCVTELPDFDRMQLEYGDKIQVIAINRKESSEDITRYLDTIDLESNILFLEDPTDQFYESIQGFSMPETLFINAEGQVVTHKRGFMTYEDMKNVLGEL